MAQNNLEPVTIKDAGIFLPPSRGLVLSKTKSLMLYKYPTTQSKTTHKKKKKNTHNFLNQTDFFFFIRYGSNQPIFLKRERNSNISIFESSIQQISLSKKSNPNFNFPLPVCLALFFLIVYSFPPLHIFPRSTPKLFH